MGKKRGGFDSGKIKGFFVQHVEKFALVLVGACFMLFVYGAATRESFTAKTPQQIVEEASRANQYVEEQKWDPQLAMIDHRDLGEAIKLSRQPIPKLPFEQKIVWNPRPRTKTIKRIQPPLLAVLDLRATPESGSFGFRDPNYNPAAANMMGGGMPGGGMPGGGMPGGFAGSPDSGGMPGMGGPGGKKRTTKNRRPGAGGVTGGPDAAGGMVDPGMVGMGGMGTLMGLPGGAVMPVPGTQLKGVRFVVLTGLVPYADQVAAYTEAFEEASWKSQHALQQYPFYQWFAVERAEVANASDDPNTLTWAPLNIVKAYNDARSTWIQTAPDVVSANYIDQKLCFPLGPLVDRQWDKAVSHSPEIPLASNVNTAAIAPALLLQNQLNAGLVDKDGDGIPDFKAPDMTTLMGNGAMGGGMGMGMGGMPGMDSGGEAGMGMGGMGGMGMGGMSGGFPGMDGGLGGMAGGMGGMGMGGMGMGGEAGSMGYDPYGTGMAVQSSPYKLFRFFDFTVQDGKQYRYRVKLMLFNPNYQLEARFVADPKTTKDAMIATPWSEPSAVASVRGTSNLLAGKVEPGRGTKEPKAKIIVRNWDSTDGSSVFKEYDLELGQIANFTGKNIEGVDPLMNSKKTVTSVDFKTDMMLVDVRGGDSIDGEKDFVEPGEMLFMGPDGRLIVKTELDDWDRYSTDQQTLEVLKNGGNMGMGMMPGEAGYDPSSGGEGSGMPGGGRPRPSRGP